MADFDLSAFALPTATEDNAFFSQTLDRGQRMSMRSARREADRTERLLRQNLGDDLLNQEMNGGSTSFTNPATGGFDPMGVFSNTLSRVTDKMAGATKPLFDMLQIGQFGVAGAAMELANTGSGFEALRRAGAEMVNALPLLDEQDAMEIFGITPTRASFTDLLRQDSFQEFVRQFGVETAPFENSRHNEWATAAGGFVLDVLLDPTTYVGGAILRVPATAIGKAIPFLGDAVPAIGAVRGKLGRNFVPDFDLKEFARRNPKSAESVQALIDGISKRKGEIAEGKVEINDVATTLRSGLTPPESRVLGLYLDNPAHFDSILKEIGGENTHFVQHMQDKFKAFGDEYRKLGTHEVKAGILDESQLIDNYAAARYPATGSSARAHNELMKRLGLPEERTKTELSDLAGRFLVGKKLGEGEPVFAKGKKISKLEHRVLASVGTELDAGSSFTLRGYESVRALATKRFVDSVLTDVNVVRRIDDPALLSAIKKGGGGKELRDLTSEYGETKGRRMWQDSKDFHDQLQERGMGVWRPFRKEIGDLTSLSKLKKGTRYVDEDGTLMEIGGVVAKGKNKGKVDVQALGTRERTFIDRSVGVTPVDMAPAYAMPNEFVKALELSDKLLVNPDDVGRKFFGFLKKIQGPWKGWALVSPSYHLRNNWSNGFNNMLAGVDTPVPYARSFAMMFPKSRASVKITAKNGTVYGGEEVYALARRNRVIDAGMFKEDLGLDTESMLFQKMYREGNDSLNEMSQRLATASGKELDDVLISKGDQNVTRRDLLSGVVDIRPEENAKEFLSRQFGTNNTILRWNHLIGKKNEEFSRLAHFSDRLAKGDSPEAAAASVRKYLFDYEELTPFERDVMKGFIPFYTWMRKNIPLQLESIIKSPGRYGAMTGKPIQAIESLSEEMEDIPTPDYFQEIHAVRMPREVAEMVQTMNESFDEVAANMGVSGTETGLQPVFVNPNFPFQDLNGMNYKDILSSMNPMLKLPLEAALGKGRGYSIFLDRPIERFEGEPAEFDLLGTGIRPRGSDMHVLETLFPPIGKLQRVYESAQRGSAASTILPEVSGFKTIQVDIERAKKGKVIRRKDKLRSIRLKYRALGLNI